MPRRIDTQAVINAVRLGKQAGDPAQPAAGFWLVYAKAAGLFIIDDAGNVTGPLSGGGDVATDDIWDAKGDLAVGTGANTAQKLTAGTDGKSLATYSGATTGLGWGKVYIEDNFNRADAATVGAPQIGDMPMTVLASTGAVGDWGITSNRLVPKSAQAENYVLWDAGVSRFKISCTIVTKPGDGGVWVRYGSGASYNDGIMVYMNDGTNYTLYTKVGLVFTKIATGSTANPSSGDSLVIYVSATRVQLFVNGAGAADIDFLLRSVPRGTMVGFRENLSANMVVDSLKVEEF